MTRYFALGSRRASTTPVAAGQHAPVDPVARAAVLRHDLVAAANEACSNSIEHAYRDSEPGRVELSAECGIETVEIRVTDSGNWKPQSADRGYRGRGLDMMRALTEELDIDHSGPGTRVRMSVTLPAIAFPVANPLRGTNKQVSG